MQGVGLLVDVAVAVGELVDVKVGAAVAVWLGVAVAVWVAQLPRPEMFMM